MNTYSIVGAILAMIMVVSATQPKPTKTDLTTIHNDVLAAIHNNALAIRANHHLGTAIGFVVPVGVGFALYSLFAPLFHRLFSAIPFTSIGFARKAEALFEGITQEKVISLFDAVNKAIDDISKIENGGFTHPYVKKVKALFGGITKEKVMSIFDTVNTFIKEIENGGLTDEYLEMGMALFERITQGKFMPIFDKINKTIEVFSAIENGGMTKLKSQ